MRQGSMAVLTVYCDEPVTEATEGVNAGAALSLQVKRAGAADGGETISLDPRCTRNMLSDQPLADNELKYQNDAVQVLQSVLRACRSLVPSVFSTCRTALRRRDRLRSFPQRPTSFRMSMLRACSATSFFRRRFSVSSSLRR